ncbi:MAG TPA: archaetidylserine decarboxylase [Polyangiales bacterium]|nr:archaetidylserine decarboxylase [Polyangiales bacterium]
MRGTIRAYCAAYNIDLSEYEVPEAGFETFDAFFTRRLKPGSRPLDPDPGALLSPADGRLEDAGVIEVGSTLRIKGRNYTVAELLDDRLASSLYAGGQFAVVYLSPRDYHRVHTPVTGEVRLLRHIDGTLFPVNAIGLRHVPRLFARNERVVIEQQSPLHGPIASVMVGAIGVGRISVSFDAELVTNDGRLAREVSYPPGQGPTLARGDELGIFHLGSTVIVFAGPASGLSLVKRPGDHVRVGEALWRRQRGASTVVS